MPRQRGPHLVGAEQQHSATTPQLGKQAVSLLILRWHQRVRTCDFQSDPADLPHPLSSPQGLQPLPVNEACG